MARCSECGREATGRVLYKRSVEVKGAYVVVCNKCFDNNITKPTPRWKFWTWSPFMRSRCAACRKRIRSGLPSIYFKELESRPGLHVMICPACAEEYSKRHADEFDDE